MEEKKSTDMESITLDGKNKSHNINGKLIRIKNGIIKYIKNNILFLSYVVLMLLNATVLRFFTVKNYFSIKPLLADAAVILIIGLFGYFIKPRKRFVYYIIWLSVFSVLSMANSIYYTNYKSFISVSLFSTASQLGGVIDAVTENILEAKDLVFLFSILIYIIIYILLRKKQTYFERLDNKSKKGFRKAARNTLFVGLAFAVLFVTTLTKTDISRLGNSWNREYVLSAFGLYTYTFSDIVSFFKK